MQVLRNQKGQSVVLFAVALGFLAGFMSLSLDAGRAFVTKERLQSAADAAALAGAAYLPAHPSQALAVAATTAEANGVPASDLTTAVVGTGGTELDVTAANEIPLYFGPLIGIPKAKVAAVAGAATGTLESLSGLVPLSVYNDAFVPGQTYNLKISDGSGTVGNFGPVQYGDASGASTYEQQLASGSSMVVNVGDVLWTQPGDMVGPTDQGLETRLQDAAGSGGCQEAENVGDLSSPCLLWVPVVTPPTGGETQVTVLAFAAFWLQCVNGGQVTGEFLKESADGPIAPLTETFATNVVGVRLIR